MSVYCTKHEQDRITTVVWIKKALKEGLIAGYCLGYKPFLAYFFRAVNTIVLSIVNWLNISLCLSKNLDANKH